MFDCCKLGIVFRNKTRLGSNFHFKNRICKDGISSVVYRLSADAVMSANMVNV